MEVAKLSPEQVVSRKGKLPSYKVDNSLITLDGDAGYCYAMNATSARIWELIDQPTSVESLCETLCREYDVDGEMCRREVIEILGSMREAGLVK